MRWLAAALLLCAPRAYAAAAPPRVNDPEAAVSASSAVISWATDQPSDAQVDYGATPAYGSSTSLAPALVLQHSATIPSLAPGALYHYRVKSKNASGALGASADSMFTTPARASPSAAPSAAGDGPPATPDASPSASTAAAAAPAERVPPSVVFMTPAADSFLSSTVTVSVNATDNVAVSSVQFLLDGAALGVALTSAPYIFQFGTAAASDGRHNLAAVATDAAGNTATAVLQVTVDNSPPQLREVTAAPLGPGTAVVRWKSSERASARVDFGTTTAYGSASQAASALVEQGAGLSGLAPGTVYHYRVTARDQAGNQTASVDAVFTTAGSTAAAIGAAAAPDSAALATQKMLSPARKDGINDAARFGPEAQDVSVFDIRGRRVFHASSAGGAVVWDCRDGSGRFLESGVYLATIIKRDGGRIHQSFSIVK
jgi:hypothetical protein